MSYIVICLTTSTASSRTAHLRLCRFARPDISHEAQIQRQSQNRVAEQDSSHGLSHSHRASAMPRAILCLERLLVQMYCLRNAGAGLKSSYHGGQAHQHLLRKSRLAKFSSQQRERQEPSVRMNSLRSGFAIFTHLGHEAHQCTSPS